MKAQKTKTTAKKQNHKRKKSDKEQSNKNIKMENKEYARSARE